MKKVTVIGHFDWQDNNMIGAVVKARNIYEELQNQFNPKQVAYVDIYEWRKRIGSVLIDIVISFVTSKNIVLVCSDTSGALMTLLTRLKRVFHNKILYCVVGGDMAEILESHPERIEGLACIDKLFVETSDCLQGLERIGLRNASILKNFKHIEAVNKNDLSKTFEKPYRFCTFSRVVEQKGITDAILAIHRVNEDYGQRICSLDIYGSIDPTYKEKFELLLEENSDSRYCGVINSNKSVAVLKEYYCLLFPTKYQTEGIPGTIIDGFAAGLPIICSDWIRCRQIVEDGKNGIVYPFGDFDALIESIKIAVNNQESFGKLRYGCLDSFTLYEPEIAIAPLVEEMK